MESLCDIIVIDAPSPKTISPEKREETYDSVLKFSEALNIYKILSQQQKSVCIGLKLIVERLHEGGKGGLRITNHGIKMLNFTFHDKGI